MSFPTPARSNVIAFPAGGRAGLQAASTHACERDETSEVDRANVILARLLRYLEHHCEASSVGPDARFALRIGLDLRCTEAMLALQSRNTEADIGRAEDPKAEDRARDALLKLRATLDADEPEANIRALTAPLRGALERLVGTAARLPA